MASPRFCDDCGAKFAVIEKTKAETGVYSIVEPCPAWWPGKAGYDHEP